MSNLRDRILSADDLVKEIMEISEWDNVKIEVRSMTGAERGEVMRRWTTEGDKVNYMQFYPAVLMACCFDPDTGERVFDVNDVDAINRKNSGVLERIARVGMKLSGIDIEATARAEGNSIPATTTSTQNGDSPTT